jgi:hypothetical protein
MKRALVLVCAAVLMVLLAVDIYMRLAPSRRAEAPARPVPEASPTAPDAGIPDTRPSPEESATPEEEVVMVPTATVPSAPRKKPPARKRPTAPTAAPGAAASAVPDRGFTPGRTVIEGASGPQPEVPPGFDAGGVDVKRLPKVAAQVEFEVQPARVKAGDPYVVKIYLRNEGKKTIKIKELRVAALWNGTRSESTLTPRLKEVPAQRQGLLAEVPSIWKADVRTWSMDVAVRSGHGEVYRNSIAWR